VCVYSCTCAATCEHHALQYMYTKFGVGTKYGSGLGRLEEPRRKEKIFLNFKTSNVDE